MGSGGVGGGGVSVKHAKGLCGRDGGCLGRGEVSRSRLAETASLRGIVGRPMSSCLLRNFRIFLQI